MANILSEVPAMSAGMTSKIQFYFGNWKMQAIKLLLGFAPWIALMILGRGNSLFMLQMSIVVAAVLVILMTIFKLHCGMIMWGSIVFFTAALIFVTVLKNMWFIRNFSIFAHGTLLVFSTISVLIGKPFTLDYAKQHTPKELWVNPIFIKTCYIIALVWCGVFGTNTAFAIVQRFHPGLKHSIWAHMDTVLMVAAVFFSSWYPAYMRRKRLAAEAKSEPTG